MQKEYLSILLPILITAFFTLTGMLFMRLLKPKKVRLQERITAAADETGFAVKKEEEQDYLTKLQQRLENSKVGITIPVYFMIMFVAALVIFLVVNFLIDSPVIAAMASVAGALLPAQVVSFLEDRRRDEFDRMFIKALKRLSASIRAEESLEQAIQDVADSDAMPAIIREEFAQCLADYTFTGDIAKAFNGIYERTGNKDVRGVAVGIMIASKLGSDLARMFDSYSQAIMTRKEMEAEGKSALLATRTDTLIVSAVPFIFSAAMKFMQPDYFEYAFAWLGGLGRYIIVALYGVVVYGCIFLLKKCNVRL